MADMGRPPRRRDKIWMVVYKERSAKRNVSLVTRFRRDEQMAHDLAELHRNRGDLEFFGEYELVKNMTQPEVVRSGSRSSSTGR